MASKILKRGKNNFPPSIYSLGLDKLLDCICEDNSDTENYIIQRDKVTKFAEVLSTEIKSYKEIIKEKDIEIVQMSKQVFVVLLYL